MSCERLSSLWETYLDGELPAAQMLELQMHLDGCSECGEAVAFSLAIRQSARHMAQSDAMVSERFRRRLSHALLIEAQSEREGQKEARAVRVLRAAPRWGVALLTSAAALVLWLRPQAVVSPPSNDAAAAERQASVALAPDELLDRLIDYHTAPPPPQVTEAKLVPEMERDVGVKVPLPSLVQYGAEWEGGSVVRVRRDQPAAYLRYRTLDDHSVTLYVYNASRIPLHAVLRPRMLREEPVYEGYRRGYTIAAQLRHGVGYAVATDLDESRSAELVHAIASSNVRH
jgi:anti-sigma factor RsiW